ncbi:MAG: flagellum-specific ATP synthase FliI [Pseudomonadota bacterium]
MTNGIAPARSTSARLWGRLAEANAAVMRINGLAGLARLGDGVEVHTDTGTVTGEVIALGPTQVSAMVAGPAQGLAAGTKVYLTPGLVPAPCAAWLGQVLDADARLPDGRPAPRGERPQALDAPPPPAPSRRGLGPRLGTGLMATDTLLPLCRGQRLGVFAGSGVGKSMLLGALAEGLSAEIVVIGLIGERGREVGEVVARLSPETRARTVVVAATSDRPALERHRAARLTLATAEYFRDQGAQVLCLLDSLTRHAEAHREIALAAGEAPALRGFPATTASTVAALCERAGPGAAGQGDITAVFTVLVAGSDMDEPVADMVRGVLDGHVVLARRIADRGRFPAIDLLRSVSRSAPAAWSAQEAALAREARRLIALQEEAEPMVQSGLYQAGADPALDRALKLWPALDAFLGQQNDAGAAAGFQTLATILAE